MTRSQRIVSAYQAANLETAHIIAADPVKYPAGSLLQLWAEKILRVSSGAGLASDSRAALLVTPASEKLRRLSDSHDDTTNGAREDGRPVGVYDQPAILRQPRLVFGRATGGAVETLPLSDAELKAASGTEAA